jgi:hypothetical protein
MEAQPAESGGHWRHTLYEIEGTPKPTTMADLEAARAEYAQVLDSKPTTDTDKQHKA